MSDQQLADVEDAVHAVGNVTPVALAAASARDFPERIVVTLEAMFEKMSAVLLQGMKDTMTSGFAGQQMKFDAVELKIA